MESLVKRYFWVVNLALLAVLAFLAAKATNNYLAGVVATLPTKVAPAPEVKAEPTANAARRAEDWALSIVNRNLFNSEPPEPEEPGDLEPEVEVEPELDPNAIPGPGQPCEKSDVSVTLVATMVAEPAEWSLAAVEDDGDRLVRIGQSVGDKPIIAIQRDRLVLRSSGRFECVELGARKGRRGPRKKPRKTPSGGSSRVSSAIKDGVKKVGQNRFEIDREMLNEQLDDLSTLSRQARVIPHYRDGKPQGFKIVGVRPGSLYSHIGIRSGDVLKAVNGEEISSPTKALELYERLKNSDNVTVDLERRGRKQTNEYSIK